MANVDSFTKLQQAGVIAGDANNLRGALSGLSQQEVDLLIGINEKILAASPEVEAHGGNVVSGGGLF